MRARNYLARDYAQSVTFSENSDTNHEHHGGIDASIYSLYVAIEFGLYLLDIYLARRVVSEGSIMTSLLIVPTLIIAN